MLALRLLWRDWRGGELGILAAALMIAVAIVTGIALFTGRLQQGIDSESRNFLAADRVLKSPRPVASAWLEQAQSAHLRQAREISFQSMVYVGDSPDAPMQLASIKAVSAGYPLRGTIKISNRAFGSAENINHGPPRGDVWVDSRLLPLLGIDIGDRIYVGDVQLTVARVVISEPDRGSLFWDIGPRVLMNTGDIAATGVIQPGSRVEYRYLFAGSAGDLAAYGQWLAPRLQPSHQWMDLKDAQPLIARWMQRAEQFLLLAGALGVGLAGIAIALAARRYSERHFDYVAVMKSLGASGGRILGLYLGNLLLLGILATLCGSAVGGVLQLLLVNLLRDYLDVAALPDIGLRPFALGIVTALVCLLAFALPPLLSLRRVSPLRVLRRDLDAATSGAAGSYGAGIVGVALLMWWYSGDWRLTLAVLSGVGLTFALVGAAAWYLLRGSTGIGMQAGSTWRLALASLRRRGAQNSVQVVIFSLSIMLLLTLALLRGSLINEWKVQLPEGTPNHFLINISRSQVGAVRQFLHERGLKSEPMYPMVRGRLVTVDGQRLRQRLLQTHQSENYLNRELNLTWSDRLPSGNLLVAGSWWQQGSSAAEVSIESGLAERLDISVGDSLSFTIGSEKLDVRVSSIRSLDWDTMKPNFYMIFPPGLLGQYPATYITSLYLSPEQKPFLNRFLRSFPTITVIEMDTVIGQIRSIVTQVSSAVEVVLGLIVTCGLLVLGASVQASLDSRFQESAILRTLGAKRGVVLGSLVIEFCVLGLLAGLLAAFASELAVYLLQTRILNMSYVSHPWVWLMGPAIGALLVGATGFLVCRKVVNVPPVRILRVL